MSHHFRGPCPDGPPTSYVLTTRHPRDELRLNPHEHALHIPYFAASLLRNFPTSQLPASQSQARAHPPQHAPPPAPCVSGATWQVLPPRKVIGGRGVISSRRSSRSSPSSATPSTGAAPCLQRREYINVCTHIRAHMRARARARARTHTHTHTIASVLNIPDTPTLTDRHQLPRRTCERAPRPPPPVNKRRHRRAPYLSSVLPLAVVAAAAAVSVAAAAELATVSPGS